MPLKLSHIHLIIINCLWFIIDCVSPRFYHCPLSSTLVIQLTLATSLILLLHLTRDSLLGHLTFLGYHCKVSVFLLLCYLLAVCSVHLYFNHLISSMMSKIFSWLLIGVILFQLCLAYIVLYFADLHIYIYRFDRYWYIFIKDIMSKGCFTIIKDANNETNAKKSFSLQIGACNTLFTAHFIFKTTIYIDGNFSTFFPFKNNIY